MSSPRHLPQITNLSEATLCVLVLPPAPHLFWNVKLFQPRYFLHCLLNARHWSAWWVMPHDVHLNLLSLPLVCSCDCRFLILCPPWPPDTLPWPADGLLWPPDGVDSAARQMSTNLVKVKSGPHKKRSLRHWSLTLNTTLWLKYFYDPQTRPSSQIIYCIVSFWDLSLH